MAKAGFLALLLLPSCFLALTGCADCDAGPPVSARDVTTGPQEAGRGAFLLDVRVTDGPGGEPLPGAGVVVYWGDIGASEWSGPRVEVGPERVVVDAAGDARTVAAAETLRLLTGGDGSVRARVPKDRIVGVVVAKDGFTEEWVPALAAGGASAGGVAVPLYRSHLVVQMQGTWGPGAASSGEVTSSQYAWNPMKAAWTGDGVADRGYSARLVELRATLNWSNGATAAGDLGMGLGPDRDGPTFFHDGGDNVALGAQSESATLGADQLASHGILRAPELFAGAASDSGFVAPLGLPYVLTLEGRFDTAGARFPCGAVVAQDDSEGVGASVPGWGLAGTAGALLVGAVALRRASRAHEHERG